MENKLQSYFNENEQIWKAWEEKGITNQKKWEVQFNFYSTKLKYKDLLISSLEEDKVKYEVKKVRTMLFFTGYYVVAKISQAWQIETLQGKTGRMLLLAEQTGTLYEGCGSFIPSQK